MRLETILVLLDDLAVRADVRVRRRGVDVLDLVRLPRDQQLEASDLIDRLATGGLSGGVLVLTDDVFLQTLELPPRAIAGLAPRELEQTLAYEAQTFTGLAASDSRIAWHRDGDQRQFLVLQCGRTDFAAIDEAVGRAGGTLLGVAHAAGVPRPLATPVGARFCRVEQWGGLRAEVRGGDGGRRVRVVRAGEVLASGEAVTEQLVAGGGAGHHVALHPTGARFDLTSDDGLARWLRAWATAFARSDAHVVALQPPESATVRNRRFLIAGVLAIGVVVAGVLDRNARHRDLLAANARLASTRAPLDRMAAKEAEIANLTLQIADARTQPLPRPADASAWSAAVAVAALEALAAERPPGLVVDEVTLGWRRCSVRGRAHASRAVDELASALAPRLALVGYDVVPGARTQVDLRGGALFDFTLDLLERAAVQRQAPVAPTSQDAR